MIVSNAAPLIYLSKAGKLELLKHLFGRVHIPEEVKIEVVDRGKELKRKEALMIEKAIKDGWVRISRVRTLKMPIELEKGEAAAIALAKRSGVREILIDEVSARTAAKFLGLKPRVTIFVLLKALEKEGLDLDGFLDALNELVRQGFRLKEEIYLEAVRRAEKMVKSKEIYIEAMKRAEGVVRSG
jgi:predicted nucleic acid-binding protein